MALLRVKSTFFRHYPWLQAGPAVPVLPYTMPGKEGVEGLSVGERYRCRERRGSAHHQYIEPVGAILSQSIA